MAFKENQSGDSGQISENRQGKEGGGTTVATAIPKLPFPARPELLLCEPVPQPLWGVAPRTIYGDRWWDSIRKRVYAVSNNCCQACGVHKSQAKFKKHVEAHERYNVDYDNGVVTLFEIISLCHACHSYIHSVRLAGLLASKVISQSFHDQIIAHGEQVLIKAGHTKFRPEIPEAVAPWNEWRMVLDDGESHYSKFINALHCDRHYEAQNKIKSR